MDRKFAIKDPLAENRVFLGIGGFHADLLMIAGLIIRLAI